MDRNEDTHAELEVDPDLGSWGRTASPYLIESQIEDYGRFARGSHNVTGWKRAVAYVVALTFLLPFLFALVSFFVNVLG